MKMQYLLILVLMKESICKVLIKFVITGRCYIDDDIEILRENIKSNITEISLYETYTSYEKRNLKICYEASVKEEDLSDNEIDNIINLIYHPERLYVDTDIRYLSVSVAMNDNWYFC